METLIQRFERETGWAAWINSDIYPDTKIYTKAYTEWLEKQVETRRVSDEEIKDWILEILDGKKKGSWYFECEHSQAGTCLKYCGGYCHEFGVLVNQLKDLFRDLIKGGEWISVKDRLPKEGQVILAYLGESFCEGLEYDCALAIIHEGKFSEGIEPYTEPVFYWMPLPTPPTP